MTHTDYAASARSYSATAAGATRRAERDAALAAQQYALAGEAGHQARQLAQCPDLWAPQWHHTPADLESRVRVHVRLADVFLRSSFRETAQAAFYRDLAATYRELRDRRAASLAS